MRSRKAIAGELSENGESFDGPPSSAIFAGAGFIYVAPDYLGLGDSTVPRHRYFHAATEASSAADLLVASRDVLASLKVRRSGELFTFGFSQGGHAALALQRLLQRRGVEVTATATVGGVFDLERFFQSGIANTTTPTVPLYIAYLLLAYDDIYDVYGRLTDVVAALPATTRELLTASYFRALTTDPDEPMRVQLGPGHAAGGGVFRAPVSRLAGTGCA